MRRLLFALLMAAAVSVAAARPVTQVQRSAYLEFARSSADWTWNHYDSLITVWKKTFDRKSIFGFRPPSRILEMATIYATLYQLEGNREYAKRAKKVLLIYGDYRQYYPAEFAARRPDYDRGVPALPDFFTVMRYIRPYEILKKDGILSKKENGSCEKIIAESIEYTMRTQEWGPMNRSALRAETIAWGVRALPENDHIDAWKTYERSLGFDNWGNWEIEDASLYHAVWLYSLLGYADAKNKLDDLFRTPEMYYYANFFLQLMCPDGMIPDFGDAYWRANWSRYLVFFEAAARAYRDPRLKWAASVIATKFVDFSSIQNTGLAYLLLDCYRYGTDEIAPKQPDNLSGEVMEDVQGKKIVYRSGWDPTSTYMLLNYRDEGDGGVVFRNYLRDGIAVEEEKMTHGHQDENSIALLMTGGSVLLHDGGYREYMPSGPYGAYRADYFHNRLCVRQEKFWMGQKQGEYRYSPTDQPAIPGQSILDFLHNAGSYRQVRTRKYDFLTFDDFDYSRTRLIDSNLGYQWDRVIVYLKDPEMFIVFDIMRSRIEEYFTAANLWHTRKIVDRGDHWYDTCYDSLRTLALPAKEHLLIYFPKNHYRFEQVEQEKRYYQNEWLISESTAQHFELGQHIGFVTVLIPHSADEPPQEWPGKITYIDSDEPEKGMSLLIEHAGETIQIGVKADLRAEMIRDYRRPKYTYDSGKIRFGNFESNADFFCTRKKGTTLSYTVVNLSKAVYGDQVLFAQKPNFYGLAFDGSSDEEGIGKVRYRRDTIRLKR